MARNRRLWRLAGPLLAGLALAGCSSGNATPLVIYVTPPASMTPIVIYVTPAPTSPAPPSPAPPTATSSPTAVPTSRAAMCTGSADNQAFFSDAARDLAIDVYCGVLPEGWSLSAAQYGSATGGYVYAAYHASPKGSLIVWEEGTGTGCSVSGVIAPASFDGLAAQLWLLDPGVPIYAVSTLPGASRCYRVYGQGMTRTEFLALATQFARVPRN
jgi:hypothetical protein